MRVGFGGLVDTIEVAAIERLPLRAAELMAPDGSAWTWGPEDAAQRRTGSAEDFCMLVTQRRSPATLDVTADGDDARRWLTIAQAFAGPPGPGR